MGHLEQITRMKKILLAGAGILLALTAMTIGGGLYLIDYALRPDRPKLDVQKAIAETCKDYPYITSWIDSLQTHKALKDTFITAPDGTSLHAFYAYAARPTRKTALVIHGYGNRATDMLHIGYMYNHSLGYNILMPDLRHAGQSGGEAIQMGWLDRLDVMQWIGAAPALFGDSLRMAVHGISMGGATTMMVSGERLPAYVSCFVDDCGYTSVWDEFKKELQTQFHLPPFPLLHAASWLCNLKYGWDFREASALEQVAKCKRPMLFIHGKEDDYVPTWMVYPLYEAKPSPKELWIVPDTEHAVAYKNFPEEYTRRVKEFTDRWIE